MVLLDCQKKKKKMCNLKLISLQGLDNPNLISDIVLNFQEARRLGYLCELVRYNNQNNYL